MTDWVLSFCCLFFVSSLRQGLSNAVIALSFSCVCELYWLKISWEIAYKSGFKLIFKISRRQTSISRGTRRFLHKKNLRNIIKHVCKQQQRLQLELFLSCHSISWHVCYIISNVGVQFWLVRALIGNWFEDNNWALVWMMKGWDKNWKNKLLVFAYQNDFRHRQRTERVQNTANVLTFDFSCVGEAQKLFSFQKKVIGYVERMNIKWSRSFFWGKRCVLCPIQW